MVAPGRKPRPAHLKLLEGNPGKRRVNKALPKPRPVRPTCPSWLAPVAKYEWMRIAPDLERLGLLTIVDRAALAGYCQAFARWKEAEQAIKEYGLTFVSDHGVIHQRPEVVIAQRSLQLVRAFCAEFGLTPSSRTRIEVRDGKEDDDMGGLLD